MNTRIPLFSTLVLTMYMVCAIALPVSAQQPESLLYVKVDYMKATGPQIADYLSVEQELWKPVHEERYRRGIILSWDFYSVVAGGPDSPYNYIAVNVFDEFDKIDYYQLGDIIESVYPDKSPDEMLERTRASREVVQTEIWKINERILQDGQNSPGGNYLAIHCYNDGDGGRDWDYADMDHDFWNRIHETRIDQNILNSWGMYSLLYPDGKARHYTHCAIDYFDKLDHARKPVGMALARAAHPHQPDEELKDIFTRTNKSRILYKTELWKRLDSVGGGRD